MRRIIAFVAAVATFALTWLATCVQSSSGTGQCWSIVGTRVIGTAKMDDATALMAVCAALLAYGLTLRLPNRVRR